MAQSFNKDPDAKLDYQIDWSTWLGTDTISTSSWAVDTGLTKVSESNTTTTATVWLSGGTLNQEYSAINTVVTAAGRTDQRTITIMLVEK